MMSKVDLNKHRQTKEYFISNSNAEYNYVKKNDAAFREKVHKLRAKFSNDTEFGAAVAKILNL
jgi:hypothetical protein